MNGEMRAGTFHEVQCIRTIWPGWEYGPRRIEWIPVLGPPHEDTGIINFPHRHWHVDRRFLSVRKLREIEREGITVDDAFRMPIRTVWPDQPEDRPGNRVPVSFLPDPRIPEESYRRTMRRRMSGPYPEYPGTDVVPWLAPLHAAFQDERLTGEMTCPHRGAPLAGLEQDPEGCVTCPLHGLRWNVRTLELAPTRQVKKLMEAVNLT